MDVLVLIVYALAALPAIRAIARRGSGQAEGWLRGLRLSAALIVLLALNVEHLIEITVCSTGKECGYFHAAKVFTASFST